MRTFSREYTGVSREDIWRVWTDVNNWPKWHMYLDYCKMDSAFEAGNHFILKAKGPGSEVKIILTQVKQGISFTDTTHFFGAKMDSTHIIEETPQGLKLSNVLVVTGILKWLWIKIVAQKISDTSLEKMDSLVNLVKKNS